MTNAFTDEYAELVEAMHLEATRLHARFGVSPEDWRRPGFFHEMEQLGPVTPEETAQAWAEAIERLNQATVRAFMRCFGVDV
jgi:hypothetical protein